MSLEDLKNLQVFMQRVQLSGAEVPTWTKCWNALVAEIERPPPEIKT